MTQLPCSFKVGPKDRWYPPLTHSCLLDAGKEDADDFGAWEALDQLSLAACPWASLFGAPGIHMQKDFTNSTYSTIY